MHKNYKGYLITWKEIYIDNENLMLRINELLPVYYCKASANETKFIYIICHDNVSLDRVQFNFGFAHVQEWTDKAISCVNYIKNKLYLINFREYGKIPKCLNVNCEVV